MTIKITRHPKAQREFSVEGQQCRGNSAPGTNAVIKHGSMHGPSDIIDPNNILKKNSLGDQPF